MSTKHQEFFLQLKEKAKEFTAEVSTLLEKEDVNLSLKDDDDDKVSIFYNDERKSRAFVIANALIIALDQMTESVNIKMLAAAHLLTELTYTYANTDKETPAIGDFAIAQIFLANSMKSYYSVPDDSDDADDSDNDDDSFDDLPIEEDADDQSESTRIELLKDQIAIAAHKLEIKIDYTEELEHPISMDVADFDKVAPYLRGVYVSFEAGDIIAMNENQFDTFYENMAAKLITPYLSSEEADEPEAETIESDETKDEDD